MKTSSLVKKYFNQQTGHLLLFFEKPVASFSEKDIHLIRVEIKRIKALLALLNDVYPSFRRKKNYAPFKVIFRQAGKIRDLQVQLLLIQTYPLNASIEKWVQELSRQLLEEKNVFFQMIPPSLIRQLKQKTSRIQHFLDRIDHKATMRFLDKKQKVIKKLVRSKQLKPAEIHQLRKRIKEFYYLQKMLEPKNGRMVNTDQFQELLGKWHDGRVLLLGLKNYRKSRSLPIADRLALETLQIKISNNNRQLFQTILHDKNDMLKLLA